ncbi:SCO3933 family regulatory protein [Streptomyces sp. NPDC001739]
MARIRVGLLPSTKFMVGAMPTPKFSDQEKTQIATDRETGQPLYTVTVFLMEDERAEAMKITVAKDGLPDGLLPGATVRPVDLFATPWARIFNGSLSDGIAYRAASLELVANTLPGAVASDAGEAAA